MNIELSSLDDVAQLLETLDSQDRTMRTKSCGGTRSARGARGSKQAHADMQRRTSGNRRRCRCGVCYSCSENARWERIYNEKFADPAYYSGMRAPSMVSPLGSL